MGDPPGNFRFCWHFCGCLSKACIGYLSSQWCYLKNHIPPKHRFKSITRCKLTIISESAICKKFLGKIWFYTASLQISNSHSLECYVVIFCLYYRFERIFLSFLWFILMNAKMSTQLKKFLQIYWLFTQDPTLSYTGKPQVVYSYSFKSMVQSKCSSNSALFRSQQPAAKDYFQILANYTRQLDPSRPITVVLNQVR